MTAVFMTEKEIASQPDIWEAWAAELTSISDRIRKWIAARAPGEIWLCGAGTSAFIGDSLAAALNGRGRDKVQLRNVPTTDLVARPYDFLRAGLRPLVVSFGRSGNSSESVGTLDLLDRMAPNADRLHITCNKEGILAQRNPAGSGELQVVILPDACHDMGFATTSSYTTILLTALSCLGNEPLSRASADRLHGASIGRHVYCCRAGPFRNLWRDYPRSGRQAGQWARFSCRHPH